MTAEYESNPALSSTNPGGIRRALFEPSYSLVRMDGASELRAELALQIARSSNTSLSLNREDPSISLNWRRQGQTGEFSLSAKYDEAATRSTAADAIGLVTVDATRASRSVSASWSKPLGERGTLSLDGAYSGISYRGGTYVGYVTRSAGLKLAYDWSNAISPFLNVSSVDQTPSGGGPSSQRTSTSLGLTWKISERLDCTAQAGKSRGSGASSSQFGANARYAGQLDSFTVSADRQTSPGGLGSFVTTDQINGSWSHELSEYTRTDMNLGWRKTSSLADEIGRTLDIGLQYDLGASWGIRAHYQRRTRDGGGMHIFSNLLGGSLVYSRSSF